MPDGSICYDLPGGGQHPYESLEEGVLREVREETGYEARILRFCGLAEDICLDPVQRAAAPNYTHRVLHIFLVEPLTDVPGVAVELDLNQLRSEWVPLDRIAGLPLRPIGIAPYIAQMIHSDTPVYIPTFYS